MREGIQVSKRFQLVPSFFTFGRACESDISIGVALVLGPL